MSDTLLPIERYDAAAFLAPRPGMALRPMPPGEPERLAPLIAGLDPWARLGYPPKAIANYLSGLEKGAPRYALMDGNDIVGALGLRLNWLRGPYLQFLVVLPEHQKKLLGSAALAWLCAEARRAGEGNVWVCATAFNDGGLRFYERHGFVRTASLEDLVARGATEILLRKRL